MNILKLVSSQTIDLQFQGFAAMPSIGAILSGSLKYPDYDVTQFYSKE